MWLFWTGPETVPWKPSAGCTYGEYTFRFMKQHLGLNVHCLTDPDSIQRWMWLCALAYCQLLLMGQDVEESSLNPEALASAYLLNSKLKYNQSLRLIQPPQANVVLIIIERPRQIGDTFHELPNTLPHGIIISS